MEIYFQGFMASWLNQKNVLYFLDLYWLEIQIPRARKRKCINNNWLKLKVECKQEVEAVKRTGKLKGKMKS